MENPNLKLRFEPAVSSPVTTQVRQTDRQTPSTGIHLWNVWKPVKCTIQLFWEASSRRKSVSQGRVGSLLAAAKQVLWMASISGETGKLLLAKGRGQGWKQAIFFSNL